MSLRERDCRRGDVEMRRRGTDQEVANVVAFLASSLSSYVHGAFLPVWEAPLVGSTDAWGRLLFPIATLNR